MSVDPRMTAVLQVIADQARQDPQFLAKLERALKSPPRRPAAAQTGASRAERPHRRAPAVLDPFEVLRAHGASGLHDRLASLSLEELRDVVAEYRVEPYTLVMKWKTPARVIKLIVETIEQRSRKGEAFR